jgi:hypothetical protein
MTPQEMSDEFARAYAERRRRRLAEMPPITAVIVAWTFAGGRDLDAHEARRAKVRRTMPELATALDRLAEDGAA